MEDEEFTPVGPLQFQSDSRDATWSIHLDARGGHPRYLLAYLTADNLFTYYDVVDD